MTSLSVLQILFPDQQSVSLPSIPVTSLAVSEDAMEENIIRDDFSSTAATGEGGREGVSE